MLTAVGQVSIPAISILRTAKTLSTPSCSNNINQTLRSSRLRGKFIAPDLNQRLIHHAEHLDELKAFCWLACWGKRPRRRRSPGTAPRSPRRGPCPAPGGAPVGAHLTHSPQAAHSLGSTLAMMGVASSRGRESNATARTAAACAWAMSRRSAAASAPAPPGRDPRRRSPPGAA